jgi:hypothetical protein
MPGGVVSVAAVLDDPVNNLLVGERLSKAERGTAECCDSFGVSGVPPRSEVSTSERHIPRGGTELRLRRRPLLQRARPLRDRKPDPRPMLDGLSELLTSLFAIVAGVKQASTFAPSFVHFSTL